MITTRRKMILIVAVVFGLSILVYTHIYYIKIIDRERQMDLQYSSSMLSEQLICRLQDMNDAVEDLGAFFTASFNIPNIDSFNSFSSKVFSNTPMLLALQFVNTNGIILYTFPVEGNECVAGLDLKPLPDWKFLEEARLSHRIVMDPKPGILLQGRLGVIFRKPLYQNDIFLGWAQCVFNIEDLLPETKNQTFSNYVMQIVDSEGKFILGSKSIPENEIITPITINDMQWKLRVGLQKKSGNFNLIMLISIWAGGLSLMITALGNIYAYWHKEEVLSSLVHKQTAKLRESKERFRVTFEQAPLGIAQINVDGRFLKVNNALCEMLGYTQAEMLTKRVQDLTPKEEISMYHEKIARIISGKEKSFIPGWEKHYIKKDNQLLWVNVSVSIVLDELEKPLYVVLTVTDISEQKKSETKLQRTTQELRDLTNRLAHSEEKTRKTIALEIHDDLGQRLTALGLALDSSLKRLSRKGEGIVAPLREAREELDNIIGNMHNIVDGLHPLILDDYGLPAAIRWNIKRFERRTNLKTNVNVPDLSRRLPDNVEIGMFRILQEALNNAVRHSKANEVSVELSEKGSVICLKISDNGIGLGQMDLGKTPSTGHGMISMRERALAMGGELTFSSNREGGTSIIIKTGGIS